MRVGGKSKGFPVSHLVIRHFVLGVGLGKWARSRGVRHSPKVHLAGLWPRLSGLQPYLPVSLLNSQTHPVFTCSSPGGHFSTSRSLSFKIPHEVGSEGKGSIWDDFLIPVGAQGDLSLDVLGLQCVGTSMWGGLIGVCIPRTGDQTWVRDRES